MASEERKAQNEVIDAQNLHNSLGAEEQQAETDAFQCGKCKQRKTRYRQAQTRSADEPMTVSNISSKSRTIGSAFANLIVSSISLRTRYLSTDLRDVRAPPVWTKWYDVDSSSHFIDASTATIGGNFLKAFDVHCFPTAVDILSHFCSLFRSCISSSNRYAYESSLLY